MSDIHVRDGAGGDLPALTELYNHYVATSPATFDLEPASVEDRKHWLARYALMGPHRLFVATERDRIVGYATSGKFREKPAYLTSVETAVYVHPDHHSRGIGTRLYTTLFAALAHEDLHRAYTGIVLPNSGSVALHARFGFRPVGVFGEVGRKFGRYWDVQWLERPLP